MPKASDPGSLLLAKTPKCLFDEAMIREHQETINTIWRMWFDTEDENLAPTMVGQHTEFTVHTSQSMDPAESVDFNLTLRQMSNSLSLVLV